MNGPQTAPNPYFSATIPYFLAPRGYPGHDGLPSLTSGDERDTTIAVMVRTFSK
jgi:hypothetical protein